MFFLYLIRTAMLTVTLKAEPSIKINNVIVEVAGHHMLMSSVTGELHPVHEVNAASLDFIGN